MRVPSARSDLTGASCATAHDDAALRHQVGVTEPWTLVEAAGTRVAVARQGRGLPLVCLHATGHGGRDFAALAERVADAVEVITVDWPGQGRSPAESEPASAERYARILIDLLPRLGCQGAVVVGCSIGGAAAIRAATDRPELIRALVLCNSGGLARVDTTTRVFVAMMVRFFAAGAAGAAWFPRAFALYYRAILSAAPAHAQRARIVASAREVAAVLAQAWHSFARPEADLREAAASLRMPVFAAWARHDRILAWTRSRPAVLAIPDVRTQLFDGSHAAFLEDPDAFATALREFIENL